jgi:hypothetical protein
MPNTPYPDHIYIYIKELGKSQLVRLSSVVYFKIHHLKEYSLFFTAQFFYSIGFHNPQRSSFSKSILYINYHLYFIIFYTTNFFSFIHISTTILFFHFNFGFV